ncbi:MAG: ankyrin repeat domain-containing protein [Kiritimatiellaeota bacterium]|nr:ankyrin repeat domain-containing protein [Kiritimatiellota bacterium]
MKSILFITFCLMLALSSVSLTAGGKEEPAVRPIPAGVPAKTRQLISRMRKLDSDEAYDELLRSIRNGNKTLVKVILFLHPGFKNKRDAFGRTPFFNAVFAEKFPIVKYLARVRAKLTIPDMNGDTPLHCAAGEGADKIVEFLLDHGLLYYEENKKGQTPIFSAAFRGKISVVKVLLERGDRVNRKDKKGNTPLHLAALNGEKAMVKLLLAADADPHAENYKGSTPMDVARTPEIKKIIEKNK